MRAGDPRIEQHHSVTRLIGLCLLANKIGTNDGGYSDALLSVVELGDHDHERIVNGPPLPVLREMHLVETNGEIHLVPGDRVAHSVLGSAAAGWNGSDCRQRLMSDANLV